MSSAVIDSAENRLAGRLATRLAGRAQAVGAPIVSRVVSWMDLVDLCRELDELLIWGSSEARELVELHKAVLGQGLQSGEKLIEQIRNGAVDVSASGSSLDVIEASLGMLRHFYASRHPDVPTSEIETVRRRLFVAAA